MSQLSTSRSSRPWGFCAEFLPITMVVAAIAGKLHAWWIGEFVYSTAVAVVVLLELVFIALVCLGARRAAWIIGSGLFTGMAIYTAIWNRADCNCFGVFAEVGWRWRIFVAGLSAAIAWWRLGDILKATSQVGSRLAA